MQSPLSLAPRTSINTFRFRPRERALSRGPKNFLHILSALYLVARLLFRAAANFRSSSCSSAISWAVHLSKAHTYRARTKKLVARLLLLLARDKKRARRVSDIVAAGYFRGGGIIIQFFSWCYLHFFSRGRLGAYLHI